MNIVKMRYLGLCWPGDGKPVDRSAATVWTKMSRQSAMRIVRENNAAEHDRSEFAGDPHSRHRNRSRKSEARDTRRAAIASVVRIACEEGKAKREAARG